jgi:hypothetical protein
MCHEALAAPEFHKAMTTFGINCERVEDIHHGKAA